MVYFIFFTDFLFIERVLEKWRKLNSKFILSIIYRINLYYFVKRHTKFSTRLIVVFLVNFNVYP